MRRHEQLEHAMEHLHTAAEALRQQHELDRQAAENAREAAEASRVTAETQRRAVSDEVHGTIATLTTLVDRMEIVEALRRDARRRTT
jgi:predicted  nucleic acid-binding Zn-ribbon protein